MIHPNLRAYAFLIFRYDMLLTSFSCQIETWISVHFETIQKDARFLSKMYIERITLLIFQLWQKPGMSNFVKHYEITYTAIFIIAFRISTDEEVHLSAFLHLNFQLLQIEFINLLFHFFDCHFFFDL